MYTIVIIIGCITVFWGLHSSECFVYHPISPESEKSQPSPPVSIQMNYPSEYESIITPEEVEVKVKTPPPPITPPPPPKEEFLFEIPAIPEREITIKKRAKRKRAISRKKISIKVKRYVKRPSKHRRSTIKSIIQVAQRKKKERHISATNVRSRRSTRLESVKKDEILEMAYKRKTTIYSTSLLMLNAERLSEKEQIQARRSQHKESLANKFVTYLQSLYGLYGDYLDIEDYFPFVVYDLDELYYKYYQHVPPQPPLPLENYSYN